MADTANPPAQTAPPSNANAGATATAPPAQPDSSDKQPQSQPQIQAQNPGQQPQSQPSQNATTTTTTDQSRGLPYYEKLRRDLRDTLQKKRLMDKSMVLLTYPSLDSNITTRKTNPNTPGLGPTRRPNLPL